MSTTGKPRPAGITIKPVSKGATEPEPEAPKPRGIGGIFGTEEEGREEEQQQLDRSVMADMLQAPFTIQGFACRRVRASTITMLQQINSPLIRGIPVDDLVNPYEEAAKFLAIQDESISVVEASKLCYDEEAMRAKVYEILDTLEADRLPELVDEIISVIKDATSTRVKVLPPKDKKKTEELGNS